MSKTKHDYGIKCPHCNAEAPDGQFEYWERIISTQRVYCEEHDDGTPNTCLDDPEYEHNDPSEAWLRCRSCWESFDVPKAFYDAEPWG